jgi:hypothetical protein
MVKTGDVVSLFFNSGKLASHLGVHSNILPFSSNSIMGLEIFENPSMNLL